MLINVCVTIPCDIVQCQRKKEQIPFGYKLLSCIAENDAITLGWAVIMVLVTIKKG